MSLQTFVKVGEITNLSDARYCAGMGVDLLGFNVVENTPGYVDSEGIIFSINKDGTGFTKVYDMRPQNGTAPRGALLQTSPGVFFGTTRLGGENERGVIFKLDINTNTYTVLHHFVSNWFWFSNKATRMSLPAKRATADWYYVNDKYKSRTIFGYKVPLQLVNVCNVNTPASYCNHWSCLPRTGWWCCVGKEG